MNKRGRPKLRLVLDAATAAALDRHWKDTTDTRVRERLQAVRLASTGHHTYAEIAQIVGRSVTILQKWFARLEQQGLLGLLRRGHGGGKPSPLHAPRVRKALEKGLREGRWLTAPQLAAWLEREHGINMESQRLYYWLKKVGGVLKVPRPVHLKKNAAHAAEFQAHLFDKLMALPVPPDRPVRVWVVDESRYGLHSFTRRCWGLRGHRIVKPAQQKYQWGYVYGALEVVQGEAQFRFMPSVNLDFSHGFLTQIADSDPLAEHVVIWDQAGFHHTPRDTRLPPRIHLLPLPPYSPELNPVERMWDIMKDTIANRVFPTLTSLEARLTDALRPFWENRSRVLDLVGLGWLHAQANAS